MIDSAADYVKRRQLQAVENYDETLPAICNPDSKAGCATAGAYEWGEGDDA